MTDKKKTTEINSIQYLTDSNGDPILNKDGSPRKKGANGTLNHYPWTTG